MRFKEFLQELDLKGAAKKSGLADLHAKQQEKKKNDFEAKWNTGMPVKVKVKVYSKKPAYKQEDPYEWREFTIDNLISIRHKLSDITLIDMSNIEDDKTKHTDKVTWAIKKDGRQLPGGLPEYLHGLPARTRKKPGFDAYDLRREAWTDSPMPTYEAAKKSCTHRGVIQPNFDNAKDKKDKPWRCFDCGKTFTNDDPIVKKEKLS